jgi:hypothetical protein
LNPPPQIRHPAGFRLSLWARPVADGNLSDASALAAFVVSQQCWGGDVRQDNAATADP